MATTATKEEALDFLKGICKTIGLTLEEAKGRKDIIKALGTPETASKILEIGHTFLASEECVKWACCAITCFTRFNIGCDRLFRTPEFFAWMLICSNTVTTTEPAIWWSKALCNMMRAANQFERDFIPIVTAQMAEILLTNIWEPADAADAVADAADAVADAADAVADASTADAANAADAVASWLASVANLVSWHEPPRDMLVEEGSVIRILCHIAETTHIAAATGSGCAIADLWVLVLCNLLGTAFDDSLASRVRRRRTILFFNDHNGEDIVDALCRMADFVVGPSSADGSNWWSHAFLHLICESNDATETAERRLRVIRGGRGHDEDDRSRKIVIAFHRVSTAAATSADGSNWWSRAFLNLICESSNHCETDLRRRLVVNTETHGMITDAMCRVGTPPSCHVVPPVPCDEEWWLRCWICMLSRTLFNDAMLFANRKEWLVKEDTVRAVMRLAVRPLSARWLLAILLMVAETSLDDDTARRRHLVATFGDGVVVGQLFVDDVLAVDDVRLLRWLSILKCLIGPQPFIRVQDLSIRRRLIATFPGLMQKFCDLSKIITTPPSAELWFSILSNFASQLDDGDAVYIQRRELLQVSPRFVAAAARVRLSSCDYKSQDLSFMVMESVFDDR